MERTEFVIALRLLTGACGWPRRTGREMLAVHDLCKTFKLASGTLTALDSVSLNVEEGQFFTLLGPSGCGKTTMLRCIAGLESPDTGIISINRQAVFDSSSSIMVAANRRRIGMVFQSYAIWPHMNVFENVAFPLRVGGEKLSETEIVSRVREALATVQMPEFEQRPATRLSGGQQQRLAMARALVMRPKLLLLDEPLSNLDAMLRDAMRLELRRLQKEHGITTVYVTHDQVEALALSDSIAVMNAGKIVQLGPPRAIYRDPSCAFVADFIGSTNLLRGKIESKGTDDAVVIWQGDRLQCAAPLELSSGDAVALSIRPNDVRISSNAASGPNVFKGIVVENSFLGSINDYVVSVNGSSFRVWTSPEDVYEIGSDVVVRLPKDAISSFRDDPSYAARQLRGS